MEKPLNLKAILVHLALYALSVSPSQENLIETRLGILQGLNNTARYGKIYHSYTKIPYAQPPIRSLRFQPPISNHAEPWLGVRDGTQTTPSCPQIFSERTEFSGYEDCLYLDVHTPQHSKRGNNYPVMFYIFGGIFKFGNSSHQSPEYFMSRDIVVVMANYRLGVIGFLSTGDEIIPGNMGLKDQLLALKWVKENIRDFGGDPERITIHGHSSGAACVHFHTLSSLSHDYFHQAIMQSGLGYSPHMFADRDIARGMTRTLAKILNCPTTSSAEMAECLMQMDVESLVLRANELQIWENQPQVIFRPTLEDESIPGAFLTQHPVSSSYPSTSKPWILGMTSAEAYSYVTSYINVPEVMNSISPNLYLPIQGSFKWTAKPKDVEFLQKVLKTHFFGNDRIGPNTEISLIDMLTGVMHGMGVMSAVEKYLGTRYLYLYDYQADFKNSEERQIPGAFHGDELKIIFPKTAKGISQRDLNFGDEIITRWVNFMYSGNPNLPMPINTSQFGPWQPVSTSRMEFLYIMANGTMGTDYFQKRFQFWKRVPFYSKYLN